MGFLQKFGGALLGLATMVVGALSGNPWLAVSGLATAASALSGPSLSESRRSFEDNSIDPQNAVPVVYGKAKLGVKWIAMPTLTGNTAPNDFMHMVGVVCHGSQNGEGIEEFHELYLDGILAVNDGAPDLRPDGGLVLGAPHITDFFKDAFDYGRYRGSATQTVSARLNDKFASEWPTTSALAGIAYVICNVESDAGVFGAAPRVTLVVSGAKVYDPRSGGSWAWSDNRALCILDMLTSKVYGAGIDLADIDLSDDPGGFEYAADLCDELVSIPGGGNQKRYTCNGVIDTDLSMEQRFSQLLSGMPADLVYQAGKWRLPIREAKASSGVTITEQDCVGPVRWKRLSLTDMGNAAHIAFIDPDQEYQVDVVQYPEAGSSEETDYIEAANGRVVPVAMDFPFTNNYYEAIQVASILLREVHPDDGSETDHFSVVVREEFAQLEFGKIVSFDHPLLGGDGPKDCWVGPMVLGADRQGLVGLELREYHSEAYTHPTFSTKPTPPTINPPDRTNAPALQSCSLSIVESTAGDQITLDVSWTGPAAGTVAIGGFEIEWAEGLAPADDEWNVGVTAAKTDSSAGIVIGNPQALAYSVRVRVLNFYGAPGPWCTAQSSYAGFGAISMHYRQYDTSLNALPSGWTPRWDSSSSHWDVQEAWGAVGMEDDAGNARHVISFDETITKIGGDVEVLVLSALPATSDNGPGVVLRGSGGATSETGYALVLDRVNDLLRLSRYNAGTNNVLEDVTPFAPSQDVSAFYWIRFRLENEGPDVVCKARVWQLGDAEPGTWDIDHTDTGASVIQSDGWAGLLTVRSDGHMNAYVSWAGDGATAQGPIALPARFTDFSEYSTGSEPSGWEERGGGSAFTVETDATSTGGQSLQETGSGGARRAFLWIHDGSVTNPDDSLLAIDQEILIELRLSDTAAEIGATVRAGNPTSGNPNGVSAILDGGNLVLQSEGASSTTIDSAAFAISADTKYMIRLRANGRTYQAKAWASADAEPGSWDVSGTHDDVGSGYPGIFRNDEEGTRYIDRVAVAFDGDTAAFDT